MMPYSDSVVNQHPVVMTSPTALDHALSVVNVSKTYLIWKDPAARLKLPLLKVLANGMPPVRASVERRMHGLCREFIALRDISFELPKGSSMAVIGRNGSGKSTLLQVIAGTLRATRGQVERSGRVAALLELGSGFNPEFTGRDNVYMNAAINGLHAEEISDRFHEVEEFAEIGEYIDRPVKTYSSGMMMRLAFSVQVLMDPEILIVDEALSVGDIFFQQKCFDRMRRLREAGTSILFVSHDLVTVSQFTQTAMVLHSGECVFLGESSVAVKEYQILERGTSSQHPRISSVSPTIASLRDAGGKADGTAFALDENAEAGSERILVHSPLAEIDMTKVLQIGKGGAEFVRLALFDSSGSPVTLFEQGSRLYVYCQIRAHQDFECLSVGVSIKDRTNVFVHGKHSIQHGIRPGPMRLGDTISFQFCFVLELAIGHYTLDIGIIDIDSTIDSGIPLDQMESSIARVCLNDGFASFQVGPRSRYHYFQLPFYGLAELDGECVMLPAIVNPQTP
jgi:lipopolysaccharide transport system ATP-binding protein